MGLWRMRSRTPRWNQKMMTASLCRAPQRRKWTIFPFRWRTWSSATRANTPAMWRTPRRMIFSTRPPSSSKLLINVCNGSGTRAVRLEGRGGGGYPTQGNGEMAHVGVFFHFMLLRATGVTSGNSNNLVWILILCHWIAYDIHWGPLSLVFLVWRSAFS